MQYYQSKIQVSRQNKSQNKKRIIEFIRNTKKCRCGALRRPIFLEKFIEANQTRNADRMATFFVALDILKKSKTAESIVKKGFRCFKILGKDKNNQFIEIHLREEVTAKNRKLYFISSYPIKKAPSHDN